MHTTPTQKMTPPPYLPSTSLQQAPMPAPPIGTFSRGVQLYLQLALRPGDHLDEEHLRGLRHRSNAFVENLGPELLLHFQPRYTRLPYSFTSTGSSTPDLTCQRPVVFITQLPTYTSSNLDSPAYTVPPIFIPLTDLTESEGEGSDLGPFFNSDT